MDAQAKEFMHELFKAYDPELGELLGLQRSGEGTNLVSQAARLEMDKLREENVRLQARLEETVDTLGRMRGEYRRLTKEAEVREEAHERELTAVSDELIESQDALEVTNLTQSSQTRITHDRQMQKERADKLSRNLRDTQKRLEETVVKLDIRKVVAAIDDLKQTVARAGKKDIE